MKLKLFLMLLSLVCVASRKAQKQTDRTGVIFGKIVDIQDRSSLPGAAVVDGGEKYTISGQNGDYEFLNVPAGTYKVSVSYMGYATQEKEISLTSGAFLEIS